MGESSAIFAVDRDVEALPIDLYRDGDRHVEHVRPSRQHVFFLLRYVTHGARGTAGSKEDKKTTHHTHAGLSSTL